MSRNPIKAQNELIPVTAACSPLQHSCGHPVSSTALHWQDFYCCRAKYRVRFSAITAITSGKLHLIFLGRCLNHPTISLFISPFLIATASWAQRHRSLVEPLPAITRQRQGVTLKKVTSSSQEWTGDVHLMTSMHFKSQVFMFWGECNRRAQFPPTVTCV